MELSAELLFVIGLTSSAIVWLLKAIFVRNGKEVPTWVYSVALGAVALALSIAFAPVMLPPFPANDGSFIGILAAALAFLGASLPVLAAAVGFARVIYEVLLKKILDGMAAKLLGGSA